jgi:hypothetical protein
LRALHGSNGFDSEGAKLKIGDIAKHSSGFSGRIVEKTKDTITILPPADVTKSEAELGPQVFRKDECEMIYRAEDLAGL